MILISLEDEISLNTAKAELLTDAFAQAEIIVIFNLFFKLCYSLCKPPVCQQVSRNHLVYMLHLISRHWCQHADVYATADVVVILLTATKKRFYADILELLQHPK